VRLALSMGVFAGLAARSARSRRVSGSGDATC
jgi:hypothetical protein